MATGLTLSLVEIIVLLFGAIILGITIHFFISSRKSLRSTTQELQSNSLAKDEWKLKYFNDIEAREKEIGLLKVKLQEAEESTTIATSEAEEMQRLHRSAKQELDKLRQQQQHLPVSGNESQQVDELRRQVKQLQQELAKTPQATAAQEAVRPVDYLSELKAAQRSLVEQNEKINQLLDNIDVIREQEEMQQMMLKTNEDLSAQIEELQIQISEREEEMIEVRKKEHLTREMSSMLDHAYSDFNILKEKIQKMEAQLTSSKMANLEFEDLKEAHTKMQADLDDYKHRQVALMTENQELKIELEAAAEQVRDSNFQRVQLQKRVSYLEELNNDLQVVSDANKKLEGQLKRIGELESMLNLVSEERDQLMGRPSGSGE